MHLVTAEEPDLNVSMESGLEDRNNPSAEPPSLTSPV